MSFWKDIKELWLKSWREAQSQQGTNFQGEVGFRGDLGARLIRGTPKKWYQRKRVTRHA